MQPRARLAKCPWSYIARIQGQKSEIPTGSPPKGRQLNFEKIGKRRRLFSKSHNILADVVADAHTHNITRLRGGSPLLYTVYRN